MDKQLQARIQEHLVTLDDDAIPFDWLYADSKKFQLSDSDFVEYIRLFIDELFKKDGKIVYGGKDTGYDWIETRDFGITPTEISTNLFKEFEIYKKKMNNNDEYMFTYNIWFAKPDDEFPMYLKRLDQC